MRSPEPESGYNPEFGLPAHLLPPSVRLPPMPVPNIRSLYPSPPTGPTYAHDTSSYGPLSTSSYEHDKTRTIPAFAPPPNIEVDFVPPEIKSEFAPPISTGAKLDASPTPFGFHFGRRLRARPATLRESLLGSPSKASIDRKRSQTQPAKFQYTSFFRSHLRTHADEKPFVCSVCGKAFAREFDRKRHESSHSGEMKFVDALSRHSRSRACELPLHKEEFLKENEDLLKENNELLKEKEKVLKEGEKILKEEPDELLKERLEYLNALLLEQRKELDVAFQQELNEIAEGGRINTLDKNQWLSTISPQDMHQQQKRRKADDHGPSPNMMTQHTLPASLLDQYPAFNPKKSVTRPEATGAKNATASSSLGLPQNFLQEFIAFFGDVLIERAGARMWADYALAHHPSDEIERRINGLLKCYTEKLSIGNTGERQGNSAGQATDRKIFEGAAKLIRRYRPKISRYFCDNAVAEPVTEDSLSSRLRAPSKQLSLTEKLGLFEKAGTCRPDPAETIVDVSGDDDVDDLLADIESIRDILISSEAFENLASEVRRVLYCDDGYIMEKVKNSVISALGSPAVPTDRHDTVFDITWNIPTFMKGQYGEDIPQIARVVALSGSALYAQATTCLEYAKTVWPASGLKFISAIESAVGPSGTSQGSVGHEYNDLRWSQVSDPSSVNGQTSMHIIANGPLEQLVELAQQLAWIGSALSASPFEDQLAYCKPSLSLSGGCTFKMSFEHQQLHPTEKACWLPMFCGASIAYGFPIPDRGEEAGLEIPLDLMTALAGIQHAVEYEGGVVMKGFSSMFIPTKRHEDRVQWHLVSSGDDDMRLSYQEGVKRCSDRVKTNVFALTDVGKYRAIVGWCTAATTLLGTDSANYENIDYSGAEDADTPLKFSGGALGFQQFGVAQLDFVLGTKDGKSHFQRSGPFQRIVSAAGKTPVVLFDTAERRAWLVPASNVLLHIAQHRHWLEPFEANGERVVFDLTAATGSSAKDVLLRNAKINLSDYETYTFRDLVLNIWSILEFLIDQNVVRERENPGAAIKGTFREEITGFEFKAIVEERSPFRQKQVMIRKTCGGWPMLVRDIDALVLFANGFEDLIRPLNDQITGLCSLWRTVPKWKDYLATTVSTVKDLYDVAGSRLDRKYLTSTRLQWHRGNSLVFEFCRTPNAHRCRCPNRLQQIVPKATIGNIVPPPGLLINDGAVIFGHSGTIQDATSRAPRAQPTSGLYSQPNISLTPVVIEPENDDPAFSISDEEIAGPSHSDTTAESYGSSITPALDGLKINPGEISCPRKRQQDTGNSANLGEPSRQSTFAKLPLKRGRHGEHIDPTLGFSENDEGDRRALVASSPRGLQRVDPKGHLRHDSAA